MPYSQVYIGPYWTTYAENMTSSPRSIGMDIIPGYFEDNIDITARSSWHLQKNRKTNWNSSGWWFQPSEKNEFVNWDDEIPNIRKFIKFMLQSPQKPVIVELLHKSGPTIVPPVGTRR